MTTNYQRAYIVGDKETGVLLVTLNPLRAALIGRAEIEAYAKRHKLSFDIVFGRVAAAIKGLILASDPPNGPSGGNSELKAIADLVGSGTTVTDAEFCFISNVDISQWESLRHGFMPIEPVITDLESYTGGDVSPSELIGPGDTPKKAERKASS